MRLSMISAALMTVMFAGVAHAEYRCSPCDEGGLQVCGEWDPINHEWDSTTQVSCSTGQPDSTEYRCSPCDQGVQTCGYWDNLNEYWVSSQTQSCGFRRF